MISALLSLLKDKFSTEQAVNLIVVGIAAPEAQKINNIKINILNKNEITRYHCL